MTERMRSSDGNGNGKGDGPVHDEQVIAPAPEIFIDDLIIDGGEGSEVAVRDIKPVPASMSGSAEEEIDGAERDRRHEAKLASKFSKASNLKELREAVSGCAGLENSSGIKSSSTRLLLDIQGVLNGTENILTITNRAGLRDSLKRVMELEKKSSPDPVVAVEKSQAMDAEKSAVEATLAGVENSAPSAVESADLGVVPGMGEATEDESLDETVEIDPNSPEHFYAIIDANHKELSEAEDSAKLASKAVEGIRNTPTEKRNVLNERALGQAYEILVKNSNKVVEILHQRLRILDQTKENGVFEGMDQKTKAWLLNNIEMAKKEIEDFAVYLKQPAPEMVNPLPKEKVVNEVKLKVTNLLGRVGGFFGSAKVKIGEKIGKFIHGKSLDGLTAKDSKKETVEPKIEIPHTEEVKEEAMGAGSITQGLTDQVPAQKGEPEKPAEDDEELDEDLDEEIDPEEEPEQESDLPAEPEPTPAPEKRAEPSVMESILSAGAKEVEKKPTILDTNSEKVKEQERLKNMSPEDRAYEAAINFTAKFEKFISGLSPLDIAKGFPDFSRRAKELLSIPEGVDEDKFDLTQDRIMYNIARDSSFDKGARDLLVSLLERRGAVKVSTGPDGKKLVTRTVKLGETAREMLKNDTPEMRKKRMEFRS